MQRRNEKKCHKGAECIARERESPPHPLTPSPYRNPRLRGEKTVGGLLLLCCLLGFAGRIRASDASFGCAHPVAKGSTASQFSPEGTHHVVVLFAKFKDEAPGVVHSPDYARDLFDPEVEGSFSHFYRTMSSGALTIEGSCLEKMYMSEKPSSEYIAIEGMGAFGLFNLEVLRKADEDVDFGQYDNDGPDGIPNSGDDDGYVDFVFVNLLSMPANFIYQTAAGIITLGLSEPFLTDDVGGPIGRILIWEGATQRAPNLQYAVGVMAHEYGHALGLPDLYDTSTLSPSDQPIVDDGAGIGRWGLMGRGALGWDGILSPFCAWSLAQLGWVDVIEIFEDTLGVVIEEIGAGGKVYKVPIDDEEYFLLEHRKSSGRAYDREHPADGLLIWHIDESGDNANEHHKLVDLECADGLFSDKGYPAGIAPDPNYGMDNLDFWAHGDAYQSLHVGNEGDATDVFDGVRTTSFSHDTNPNTCGYSKDPAVAGQNRATGIMITHIHPQGGAMVADFAVNHWAGSIVGHTVWSDTVRVFGDITLEEGATLEVDPGTEVRFQPSDELRSGVDPDRIELIVRGTLCAQGGWSNSVILFAPSEKGERWYGIRLEGNAVRVHLESAMLAGALYGIYGKHTHADVTLMKNVGIKESLYGAIRLEEWDGRVELADAWLFHCGGNGITLCGSGTLSLARSSVMNMGATGIYLEGPTLALSFSSVYENAGDGIHLVGWEGKSEIRNSGLNNNGGTGLRAAGGEVLKVTALVAMANAAGNIRIEDTFFECNRAFLSGMGKDGGFGLRALRVSGSVTGTIFENHETAVWVSSSPLTFSGNTFRNNANALLCDASPVPVLSPLNILLENLYSVRNTTPEGLRAENNWWGTPEFSEIRARIEGNVQWRPFLVSDPTGNDGFVLDPNFPNPFDVYTVLPFQVPMDKEQFDDRVHVMVTIYNGSGQRVCNLLNRLLEPGYYAPIWDGRDERDRQTASGIYVYKIVLYDPEGKEVAAKSAGMVRIK